MKYQPRSTTRSRQKALRTALESLETRTLLSVVNEFALSSTTGPLEITNGPDSNLWMTSFSGEPGSFNPTTHAETSASTGLSGETGIVAGPDGNLWVADANDNAVLKMNTSGTVLATYSLGDDSPQAITVGPDGNIWTANSGLGTHDFPDAPDTFVLTADFSRITTGGAVTTYSTGLYSVTGAAITTGADGALWIAASSAGTGYSDSHGNDLDYEGTSELVQYKPGNAMNIYDVGAQNAYITSVTPGPDGAVYYTQANNTNTNVVSTQELVGKVTTNSDNSLNLTQYIITADTSSGYVYPSSITAGADGKLWIAENAGQSVASLDPSTGTIATYDVPTSGPGYITSGSDGNIWFTEPGADTLGEIDLSQFSSSVAITANGTSIGAMAEVGFTGPVATFTSNLATASASHFTASINWGDGNVSAGTISLASDGQTYIVSGSDTYATPGSYPVTVTITAPDAPTAAVANSVATVSGSILAIPTAITHAEKAAFTDVVATFAAPAGSYTATINWGDSTTSTGTIVATSTGYQVVGTHTYATQGNYTAHVTIADSQQSVSVNSLVTISDIPLVVTGDNVTTIPLLKAAIGVVATFTDDPGMSASNFTASINWGDGSSSGGLIVANPLQSGQFFVLGVHLYKKHGTYTTATTIDNLVESHVVTATGIAVV